MRNNALLPLLLLLSSIVIPFSALTAQGGYALDFDGTDDYVSIADDNSLDLTNSFTIEYWVNPTTSSGTVSRVLSKLGAYGLGFTNTQLLFTKYGIHDYYLTYSIATNSWTHLAVVFNAGNDAVFFVNGENAGTIAGSIAATTSTSPLLLGHITPGVQQFQGKLDELRIWSDIRTQAEIQANMHKELVGNEANLVAYYQMSDGSGTSLTDNSTNSYTGTITNGPTWKTSGAHAGPGMVLDFDGTNDYVLMGSCPAYSTDLTYEAWIKLPANPFVDQIIGFDGVGTEALAEFRIYQNKLELLTRETSASFDLLQGTTNLTGNTWHHVAAVKEGTTGRLYVDGVLEATGTMSLSPDLNYMAIGLLHFNGTPFGGDYYFGGQIDEVRIWSTARSEAQLRASMYRSLDGDEANLEAYYRFDQQPNASNTVLRDLTGNGYNGTLTNMDATTDWVASAPFNTWIGSEDSDWSNADNWGSGTVPSSEDVGIFAWNDSSNAPASANISGRNLYVDAGASLSHSGDLTLSGDYYNAGTFTTTGNVTFSGSTAQTIRGTGTSTFGTLTINNAAGVTLEQGVSVSTNLTLSSGILNLGGQTLTLGSSASVSGSPAGGNHVNATSGTLRKSYSGTGSFTYPVGDGTNYTPISLDFTSGTFASAYTDISLSTSKHPSNTSGSHFLRRYWTASSSGISDFSCDVSATYVDGDINGTESELYGGKWSSGWILLDPVNTATNEISGTISSFSDFTAGEAAAFPVEWISFEAESTPESVDLTWATASESNSHYFGVERSNDLGTWTEIGQVEAAGFSTQESHYLFTDLFPTSGENFYRLRQVDFDGRIDYSEVRSVWMNESLKLYPNPVLETLNLELPAGDWHATMFDQQGREVRSISQVGSTIDMERMPAGVYYLILENEQGQRMSERVIRQ